jgi:uncharacterized repeat protein (TIGR03843 family)
VLRTAEILEVLTHGELTVEGRLVDASNATLLAVAEHEGVQLACVYKPTAGERPLWDFPEGTLGMREVATYEVSASLGWDLVPPTAWRDAGPFGGGMAQAWVTADAGPDSEPGAGLVDVVDQGRVPEGWLEVVDAHGTGGRPVTLVHAEDDDLRRMCVLDSLVNNADRKGGHVLRGRLQPDEQVRTFGVDHGVTFSEDEKLRTVLWGWAGEALDDDTVDDLERLSLELDGALGDVLGVLLSRRELARTKQRVLRRLRERAFPLPGDGWPSLPWPAF